jgi:peptidoglycan/xylan/chitin deacetylase (PgdA/CDA1 family)
LYSHESGDGQFLVLEAAMRDWLFGCNPWGTSMICDLPQDGDSPQRPHSSYAVLLGDNTSGGLVDGPVYRTIFESLKGIELKQADEYAPFQKGLAVYHDDVGDYSSNEPTMDGTASLIYYLSALNSSAGPDSIQCDEAGGIVRFNSEQPTVYLVFSADTHFEGAGAILNVLKEKSIKGSFFLTGNCLRNKAFKRVIQQIVDAGHYVGPHSDGHLLYNDWTVRDSLLVSKSLFESDLKKNMAALKPFGVEASSVSWFLPPYEWYNKQVVHWSKSMGLKLINLTPGTGTNADYTIPEMKNYRTSDQILSRLWKYEEDNLNGLNGAILLIHPGVHPDRKDKLYNRLDEIVEELINRGYGFGRL